MIVGGIKEPKIAISFFNPSLSAMWQFWSIFFGWLKFRACLRSEFTVLLRFSFSLVLVKFHLHVICWNFSFVFFYNDKKSFILLNPNPILWTFTSRSILCLCDRFLNISISKFDLIFMFLISALKTQFC